MDETSKIRFLVACDHEANTGYHAIATGLFSAIANAGATVTVLGRGYDGRQHELPYGLIQTETPWLPVHVQRMIGIMNPTWVVLMMDIPKMLAVFQNIEKQFGTGIFEKTKFAAVFPVEAPPVMKSWADGLKKYTRLRFTFTSLGHQALANVGVSSAVLNVSVRSSKSDKQRQGILTVAQNQHRKALDTTLMVAKELIQAGYDSKITLVTNPNAKNGWDIVSLIKQIDMPEGAVSIEPYPVSTDRLTELYETSKLMLLTSLAEGIGLPIVEARAHGCLTAVTDGTGAAEYADILLPYDRVSIYPWGNTEHRLVDVIGAAAAIMSYDGARKPNDPEKGWDVIAGRMLFRIGLYEELTR